jgi:hypothetical protein
MQQILDLVSKLIVPVVAATFSTLSIVYKPGIVKLVPPTVV